MNMRKTITFFVAFLWSMIWFSSCSDLKKNYIPDSLGKFTFSLQKLADSSPGHVGIAIISSHEDTVVINNLPDYPLMSVFKMHQALGVADALDKKNVSFDSILKISANEIDNNTWSPLREKLGSGEWSISIRDLLKGCLIESDNNASNILFSHISSVSSTDSLCRILTGRNDFDIKYSEQEMQSDNFLCYSNKSSPLCCAVLITKIMTDSLVSPEKQNEIREMLLNCRTGQSRLAKPLDQKDEIKFAHKTGSGYVNERGEVTAVNDVGIFFFPDGNWISLAVLIKDYPGTFAEAEKIIAIVSFYTLKYFCKYNSPNLQDIKMSTDK